MSLDIDDFDDFDNIIITDKDGRIVGKAVNNELRPVLNDCELCGEPQFELDDDLAEMYKPGSPSVLCHAQCGLDAGLELA